MFLARFRGFSTRLSTYFSNNFWRGMKEYAKFTTISDSLETHGACWLFRWGYFSDQSANKMRKNAENLKLEIWFTEDQHVHMRLQTLKVSHKMLMSYFYESRSFIKRHREIFTTIKEDNLDFDHILPQFQRKIAFSSLWPPRFKSLQITLSLFLFVFT